jgi:hypothetical protein
MVTLPSGEILRRQRAVMDESGTFRAFDKRTAKVKYEVVPLGVEQVGRNKWLLETSDGQVKVAKSGCGCGR